jgi:hypothetical protein
MCSRQVMLWGKRAQRVHDVQDAFDSLTLSCQLEQRPGELRYCPSASTSH